MICLFSSIKEIFTGQPLIPFQGGACKARKSVIVVPFTCLPDSNKSKYLFTLYGRGFGIKASAYIYSTVVILLLFSQRIQHIYESKKHFIKRFIEYIGQMSFGIYLIHMFIVSLVSKYFDIHNWIINWGIVLVFTILIIQILKAILPVKITGKYLGIL